MTTPTPRPAFGADDRSDVEHTGLPLEAADQGPGLYDAQVAALLAGQPDPGPMPDLVAARIEAALREAAVSEGAQRAAAAPTGSGEVVAITRRRPAWIGAAAAAAAVVALVAAGTTVLNRPDDVTVSAQVSAPSAPPVLPAEPRSLADAQARPDSSLAAPSQVIHVQISRTTYTASDFVAQAHALLSHPGRSLTDLAAESPAVGPIATPRGLNDCLSALGVTGAQSVSVDLARYGEQPAAVIVVTSDSGRTAYVVQRSCRPGAPGVLRQATPLS